MSRSHRLICLPQHAPKIIDGTKTTTIRAPRKYPIAVGDTITFAIWKGVPFRSRQERVRVVTVKSVQTIRVTWETCRIDIDGVTVSPSNSWTLAVGDGFQNSAELIEYLTSDKKPEFSGAIYGWD